jgi:hypothetical protein
MTMDEFVLWTLVMGGTPLALVLIQRAAEWSLDLARATVTARGSVARERRASDSTLLWTHV